VNDFWLQQAAFPPEPQEIVAYLLSTGWTSAGNDQRWAMLTRRFNGDEVVLEVPLLSNAGGYPRAVTMLISDLSRLEERSATLIIQDMRASRVDTIRLALEGAGTRRGTISVSSDPTTFQAARDLLLSAACSAVERRPVFAKRKPDAAMAFLDAARIARAEPGSFMLSVEVPIPPDFQQTLANDADPPFARKVSILVARGIAGAVLAAREAEAGAGIDAFLARTGEGVSANLCEAIGALVNTVEAGSLRASVSFATHWPVASDVPRSTIVTPEVVPALQEAARELRAEAVLLGTDAQGPVVKLHSDDVTRGGDIVIHADVEDRLRFLRITLGPAEYAKAVDAHKQDRLVRIVGDLAREGVSWTLQSPRRFAVIDMPEDEV